MATESGTQDLAVVPAEVEARLRREPHCFEFFQAVRLLERLAPDAEPVGRFVPPRAETVRFGVHPTLAFPASQIQSLDSARQGPPRMVVNFFGLTGPLGVLPIYYTELVQQRLSAKDTALRDLLDLFHHRLLSFFYRAWEKYRFHVGYGRRERDRFTQLLLDFSGLGTTHLQQRQAVPDKALVFYTGLLAQQPHSAVAFEHLLQDYFGVPVRVEQFVGGWYRLDSRTQTCFDEDERAAQLLGGGAVVGDEIWEPQARLRIVLGPLRLAEYLRFLPTGSGWEPLRALARFYSGEEFDVELQLVLKRSETPACELGAEGDAAPQLGWVSWARSADIQRDPHETILPL